MFNVGDKVTVAAHPEHSGEVVEILYRVRSDGVRGATHLHTAADLMPPLPPGPATGEELVTALTRKFKPEMVAELLELVSAGEITRAVLSQLTDIEIERIPDSSPAQVGARQGSHMAKAATRTRSGSYPLTPRNHDQ